MEACPVLIPGARYFGVEDDLYLPQCMAEYTLRGKVLFAFYAIPRPVRDGAVTLFSAATTGVLAAAIYALNFLKLIIGDFLSFVSQAVYAMVVMPTAWAWNFTAYMTIYYVRPLVYFGVCAVLAGMFAGYVLGNGFSIAQQVFPDDQRQLQDGQQQVDSTVDSTVDGGVNNNGSASSIDNEQAVKNASDGTHKVSRANLRQLNENWDQSWNRLSSAQDSDSRPSRTLLGNKIFGFPKQGTPDGLERVPPAKRSNKWF